MNPPILRRITTRATTKETVCGSKTSTRPTVEANLGFDCDLVSIDANR